MSTIDPAALLAGVSSATSEAMIVSDLDDVVVWANEAVRSLLGWSPAELVGCPTAIILSETATGLRAEHVREIRSGGRCEPHVELEARRDGGQVQVEVRHGPVRDDEGILAGFVTVLTEVTDSQRALRFSEALHRAIVETAQEGILATDEEGFTILANQSLANILGRPMGSLYHREVRDLVEQSDRSGGTAERSGRARYEFDYEHPDRGDRVLLVSRRPLPSRAPGSPGSLYMVSDVTEARAAEASLRRQALHDPLTGLPNRYLLMDRLELAAARQQRAPQQGMAVLFIDLDEFKTINDENGHSVGDEVLVEVARRLAGSVRASDTVGRLGGDEFAVICEEVDLNGALTVATRIHQALDPSVVLEDGRTLRLTTSIGVAVAPPHRALDLLREADSAMYRVKQTGGGQTAVAAV